MTKLFHLGLVIAALDVIKNRKMLDKDVNSGNLDENQPNQTNADIAGLNQDKNQLNYDISVPNTSSVKKLLDANCYCTAVLLSFEKFGR